MLARMYQQLIANKTVAINCSHAILYNGLLNLIVFRTVKKK